MDCDEQISGVRRCMHQNEHQQSPLPKSVNTPIVSCRNSFAKFLHTENVPHAAHFFAANMLRSKIERNLHEVPRDHHDGLYSMLMKGLTGFNDKGADENVRTQLSIAVALLIIQRTDWTQHVRQLIDALAKTATLDILLNLLTRLPEELYTFNIPVSPRIQDQARTNLRAHSAYVLKLLHDLFRAVQSSSLSENMSVKLKVLKCFAAWLDFMDDHFYEYITNYTILTKLCFDALQNDALFKDACACISQILRLNGSAPSNFEFELDDEEEDATPTIPPRNQEESDAARQHSHFLLCNIIALKPMYDACVKGGDAPKCFGLTRLFVHTAEQNVAWMLNSTGNSQAEQLINIVLDCAKHGDAETACYVCYFWSRLLTPFKTLAKEFHRQACYALQGQADGRARTLTVWDRYPRAWPNWCKPYVSTEQGLVAALLPILVNAAKLTPDYEEMDRDEQEETEDVRWQVPDNIADICCVLGAETVLHTLSRLLDSLSGSQAYECEAVLFCIESTPSDTSSSSEYEAVLLSIFAQICRLKTTHCAVRRAAMRVIAYHGGILDGSGGGGGSEVFVSVCTYVLRGLDEAALQTQAVRAMLELCHKFVHSSSASSSVSQLTQLLLQVYEGKSDALRAKDELMLLEAATVLVDACAGADDRSVAVQRLLRKHRCAIDTLLQQTTQAQQAPPQQPVNGNGGRVADALYHAMNCVSCVFKHLTCADLSGALLRELWPQLRFILTHFSEHEGVMEKTTRVLKHVMRNSSSGWFVSQRDFSLEVLQLMTDLYCERCPQSSFLYIVWTFVDEGLSMPERLMASLVRIAQCTLQNALECEQSFGERPYIVEDFYELCVLFLRKHPQHMVANEALMRRVFERAMDGLTLDHKSAHHAVCNFYREVLHLCDDQQRMAATTTHGLFVEFAPALVYKMLTGVAGAVKYERAQTLAELLHKLYKALPRDRELVRQCLHNAVQRIHIDSQDPTPAQFLEFFAGADGKHQRINACLDWFVACNRYQRSHSF